MSLKRTRSEFEDSCSYDHGFGIITLPCGTSYTGYWKNGLPHGYGIMKCSNSTYDGSWKFGERCGYGKMTYSDGESYVGEWVNDQKCGRGLLTKDGSVLRDGYWIDGEPVDTSE